MIEAWLVQARWGDKVMLEIPIFSYLAAPGLFMATMATRMPAPPIRLDPISAAIYFMHVLLLALAHAAGITHVAGLMLFAVGAPAVVAILMGRFALPGLRKSEAVEKVGSNQPTRPARDAARADHVRLQA